MSKGGEYIMTVDKKESFLQIRIDKELKEEFSKSIKSKEDTVSGYLTRMIYKYVQDNSKKEKAVQKKEDTENSNK